MVDMYTNMETDLYVVCHHVRFLLCEIREHSHHLGQPCYQPRNGIKLIINTSNSEVCWGNPPASKQFVAINDSSLIDLLKMCLSPVVFMVYISKRKDYLWVRLVHPKWP